MTSLDDPEEQSKISQSGHFNSPIRDHITTLVRDLVLSNAAILAIKTTCIENETSFITKSAKKKQI